MFREKQMLVKPGEEYPIPSIDTNVQKLPVIFCVDVSGSMSSEIAKINQAINKMIDDIKSDSVASRQVETCFVSFNDNATLIQNWKPITETDYAEYCASGCTNLEAGLSLALEKSIERSRYYESFGMNVRMPFLIIITDGHSNGPDFSSICSKIRERENKGKLRPFTIAVTGYDKNTVAQLSAGERVLEFVDPIEHNYMEFFNFMTQSLKALSTSSLGENVTVDSNLGDVSKGSNMQIPNLPGTKWLN